MILLILWGSGSGDSEVIDKWHACLLGTSTCLPDAPLPSFYSHDSRWDQWFSSSHLVLLHICLVHPGKKIAIGPPVTDFIQRQNDSSKNHPHRLHLHASMEAFFFPKKSLNFSFYRTEINPYRLLQSNFLYGVVIIGTLIFLNFILTRWCLS